MNREQEIRAEVERRYIAGQCSLDDALDEIAWLLSELARLRTEAHQMQEATKGYRIAGEPVSDAVGEEFGRLIAERDRMVANIPLAAQRCLLLIPPGWIEPTVEQIVDAITGALCRAGSIDSWLRADFERRGEQWR